MEEDSVNYVQTFDLNPSSHLESDHVQTSEDLNELALALSKAQSELEAIGKEEEGYGYNYASLASTIRVAKPILAKNNLAVTQLLGDASAEKVTVTTILLHSSGQYIKNRLTLPKLEQKGCNKVQSAGSAQSYGRRYSLQAILGLASEDVDASTDGTKKTSFSKKASTTKSKPEGQKFRRKKKTDEVEDEI